MRGHCAKPIDICIHQFIYTLVALFKQRVLSGLEETVQKTQQAQKLDGVAIADQELADFKDGEKLAAEIDFIKNKALKYFGQANIPDGQLGEVDADTNAFDTEYITAASTTLSQTIASKLANAVSIRDNIRAQRASTKWFILKLVKPALPFYFLGLILSSVQIFCLDGPLVTFAMPVLQNAIAKHNPNASSLDQARHQDAVWEEAWTCLMLVLVGYAFSAPISLMASGLSRSAKRKLRNPLRTHIMRTIVKQDTEVGLCKKLMSHKHKGISVRIIDRNDLILLV